MQALKEEVIGSVSFYIAASDSKFDFDDSQDDYLVPTSGEATSIPELKDVISSLASGLFDNVSKQLKDIPKPSEIKVELSVSLAQKLGGWIIGLQSDQKINLTFTWKGNV
jgi:hypothetical protein